MKLQIYAEDTYCEGVAILANKAARHWYEQRGGVRPIKVLATPMTVSEMYKNMPSLVKNAKKEGCGCVAFVVDREGLSSRHHREPELQRIQNAFDALCGNPPGQIKVMLITAGLCFESWLLADAEGLVEFTVHRKGKSPIIGLRNAALTSMNKTVEIMPVPSPRYSKTLREAWA